MTGYEQPELDGLTEGARLRDQGIGRVLYAPDQDTWREDAYHWLAHLPTGTRITSTDLINAVGMPPSPNAVGAVMRSAGTQGLLVATEQYVQSPRPSCHAAVVRIWIAA